MQYKDISKILKYNIFTVNQKYKLPFHEILIGNGTENNYCARRVTQRLKWT